MTQAPLTDQPDLYAALRDLRHDDLEAVLASAPAPVAARLRAVDAGLLRAVMRAGTGKEAVPGAGELVKHLAVVAAAPMFDPDIATSASMTLPTGGQRQDMPVFSDRAFDAWFASQQVAYGLGLYGERRSVYATPQFADSASPERRTIHLGLDVFAPAGTPLHAPLAGRVRHLTYNADPLDYGHTLILEHEGPVPFFTLYGHLGGSLPELLRKGAKVTSGQLIGHLGDWSENGGWAPHLHFQIITTLLDQQDGNFFGVGHASLWDVWQQISPDPNLLLRLDPARLQV